MLLLWVVYRPCTHFDAEGLLPAEPSVVKVHGRGAVPVAVAVGLVPPTASYEGPHLTVYELVVVDTVATHLQGKRHNYYLVVLDQMELMVLSSNVQCLLK